MKHPPIILKKHSSDIIFTEFDIAKHIIQTNIKEKPEMNPGLRNTVNISCDEKSIQNTLQRNDLEELLVEMNVIFSDKTQEKIKDIQVSFLDDKQQDVKMTDKYTGKIQTIPHKLGFTYSLRYNRIVSVYQFCVQQSENNTPKFPDSNKSPNIDKYVQTSFYPYLKRLEAEKQFSLRKGSSVWKR